MTETDKRLFDQEEILAAELFQELNAQSQSAPGGDTSIGRMWKVLNSHLEAGSILREPITQFAAFREGPVSEKAGILRTIITADVLTWQGALPTSEHEWDNYFTKLAAAYRAHNSVARSGHEERIDAFTGNLFNLTRRVQTNIYKRYGPVELVAQLHADRFPTGINWLDVGSGINEGVNALMLKQEYPLPDITALRQGSTEPDELLTSKLHKLLRMPSLIRRAVGVDLFDPKEQKSITWAFASLRYKEQEDPDFRRHFNMLAHANPLMTDARKLDITDDRAVDAFREEHPALKFNLVTALTMTHQLSPRELQTAEANMRKLASDDAVLVNQDFIYTRGHKAPTVGFYKQWFKTPFRYRTVISDRTRPDIGQQEIFRLYDSRCERLQLGVGQLALNGELVPVEDALHAV